MKALTKFGLLSGALSAVLMAFSIKFDRMGGRSYADIRAMARQSLKGKWLRAVFLTAFLGVAAGIYGVLDTKLEQSGGAPLSGVLFVVYLFVMSILSYGFATAMLSVACGYTPPMGALFVQAGNRRAWGTILLMNVYISLWSLLLVVPGIVKSYSYAMTPYLLRDHPELSYNAAIECSMEMMKGHKKLLFTLDLTFLGWGLLALLSGGIGFFWLAPYMQTAHAHFYRILLGEE